jgi:hypothetical protein
MNRPSSSMRHVFSAVAIVLTIAAGSGCELLVDPLADEWADQAPVTTPSAEAARAAETTPNFQQRDFSPMVTAAESGAVTHGPLYFEDPFEEGGSNDGRYAWTWEDFFYEFLGPGRFVINGVASPVSVVATPPWTVMVSDGRPSREVAGHLHDAERRADDDLAEASMPADPMRP